MQHSIKFGDHYFFPMSPMQNYGFISISGYGDEIYTECVVEKYIFDEKMTYKIVLAPIDNTHFGKRQFYIDDFEQLIEDGVAIKKDNDSQRVEYVRFIEPIEGTCAYIIHEGTCVVGEV